ncbi:hypothetical protein M8542_18530 [Amycolatopsis sp. OK19-0408]|uniref:DUF6801 domain-containing protein n=1 Tax=Amycolatopsis iheyensis TaxID=2945988 RepID=A0A9X2NA07_9PSEU|nr:DUF6801 domain-containing protein [Amycolatopsis iheyensis]MCR6484829.1 hypothetical protein [Amycolatopsis iheyensis]
MRTRLTAALVVAIAATTDVAGPAGASTLFQSGTAGYTCVFPGSSVQPVTITEEFTGPDTAAPGAVFTLTNLSGSITLSAGALAALTAAGYDGTSAGASAMIVTPTNATGTGTGTAGLVQAATWGTGPATITFRGGRLPFTAGTSGEITFRRSKVLSLLLSLHRSPGSTARTSVDLACTQPEGQVTPFTPALPIG